MNEIENIIKKYSESRDLRVEEIPNLDLYMDQILTFFSDHFSKEPEDKSGELLTKSMINNYTKEKILSPIKGKKYNKNQIIQLLCIMNLKQTLSLTEIKALFTLKNIGEAELENAYTSSLSVKDELITLFSKDLINTFKTEDNHAENKEENTLEMVLILSSLSNFLKCIASDLVAGLEE